ncbi:MAG TPA: hypothetical protein VGM04_07215 [Sphingomicrobium sp.]
MTKLLLIALGLAALANSFTPDRSDPPLLIDGTQTTAPLDAQN